MKGSTLRAKLMMLMLAGTLAGAHPCAAGEEPAAPSAPAAAPAGGTDAAVQAAAALPQSPARLFAALAKDVRPQWRPYFRASVPRAGTDRFKTALSLGAVCADCFLAAEAHDAQQILNLLTDMTALERALCISRQAAGTKLKFADLAESGDWAGIRVEIASLMDLHREALTAQKDDLLVELERTGLWLRAFHIGARFSSKLTRPPEQPCVWSAAMLLDLQQRTARITEGHQAPALQLLNGGLADLQKIWTAQGTAQIQLAATLKSLDALMADLIGDDSAKPAPASP